MARDGVEEAVAIVMAPHYSKLSIGKYMEIVDDAAAGLDREIVFHKVEHWHTQPDYITALEVRVREGVRRFEDNRQPSLAVIFSAHSLPEKILDWKDLYHNQLMETSWLIADRVNLQNWHFAYQSAGRTPEPWLGPDILDVINDLAKNDTGSVLICPVGFIADHLEVLYDIDVDAMPHAEKLGLRMERVRMLNDDPMLIDCLAKLAQGAFLDE
jgi:ferrochelatase